MWVSVEKIDHLLVPGPGRLVRQRNHVAPCGLGQVLGRVRFRARQLPVAGELVELLGTAGFQRFGDAAVHPCSSARTQLVEQRVAHDRMDETEPVDAEFDDDAGASNVLEQIQHVVGLLAADIGDELDIERGPDDRRDGEQLVGSRRQSRQSLAEDVVHRIRNR